MTGVDECPYKPGTPESRAWRQIMDAFGVNDQEGSAMESTLEQRAAVARDGCRTHGHSFDETLTLGRLAPQQVICRDCGSLWRIHPDDVTRDFGSGG